MRPERIFKVLVNNAGLYRDRLVEFTYFEDAIHRLHREENAVFFSISSTG